MEKLENTNQKKKKNDKNQKRNRIIINKSNIL